jgi:hypothetical protein
MASRRAAAIAVLMGMSQTGCSLATYRRPADPNMTLYEPAPEPCTTNPIAPIADVGGAVFTGAMAVYMVASLASTPYLGPAGLLVIGPVLAVSALFACSAWYGFQAVGTCNVALSADGGQTPPVQ